MHVATYVAVQQVHSHVFKIPLHVLDSHIGTGLMCSFTVIMHAATYAYVAAQNFTRIRQSHGLA